MVGKLQNWHKIRGFVYCFCAVLAKSIACVVRTASRYILLKKCFLVALVN